MARLGRPLPPATEAEAEVSPSDVELARDAWRRDAPPGWKRLLDAELDDESLRDITIAENEDA